MLQLLLQRFLKDLVLPNLKTENSTDFKTDKVSFGFMCGIVKFNHEIGLKGLYQFSFNWIIH